MLKERVWEAQVPRQMRAAFLEAVADGRIRSMQNKLMPAAPIHRPGALLLGDAFNMRHPLTGQAAPFSELNHPASYECSTYPCTPHARLQASTVKRALSLRVVDDPAHASTPCP